MFARVQQSCMAIAVCQNITDIISSEKVSCKEHNLKLHQICTKGALGVSGSRLWQCNLNMPLHFLLPRILKPRLLV